MPNVENFDPQEGLMMATGSDNPEIVLPDLSEEALRIVRLYLRLGKQLGFIVSMKAYCPIITTEHETTAAEFCEAESQYLGLGYTPILAEDFVHLAGWHIALPERSSACKTKADGDSREAQGLRFVHELERMKR